MRARIGSAPAATGERPSGGAGFWLLTLCMVAPVGFDIARKLLPDSRFLLAATYPLIAGVWLLSLRQGAGGMPAGIRRPLKVWMIFQSVYLAMTLVQQPEVGIIAFFTHIAPMGMAWIAFVAMSRGDGLKSVYLVYSAMAVALLPFALKVIFQGAEDLPMLLRPNEGVISIQKEQRAGMASFAGIFNTQHVLSLACLACAYLAMAHVVARGRSLPYLAMSWAVLVVCAVLIFSSLRRGALFALVPGLAMAFLRVGTLRGRALLVGAVAIAMGIMVRLDSGSEERKQEGYAGRLDFLAGADFSERFEGVFLETWWEAVQARPLGSLLGAASAEGEGRPFYFYAEVGAAALTAETGILGSLLILGVVARLVAVELRMCRRMAGPDRAFCTMMVVFQATLFVLWFCKEARAVGGAHLGNLLFWAVPGIVAGVAARRASAPAGPAGSAPAAARRRMRPRPWARRPRAGAKAGAVA